MNVRWKRLLLSAIFACGLAVVAAPARAQDAAPVGGVEEVEPLYGYFGTGLLAAGAIFVLCKSSRRSA